MLRGHLSERHEALLAALAAHVDRLALEVEVGEVEPDRLGASQPPRVEELEQRPVSKRERRVALDLLEERIDFRGLRRVRQPSRSRSREGSVRDARGTVREAQARADGGNAAGDRRRCEPLPAVTELGDPVRENARVGLLELEAPLVEPAREGVEIRAIGALRRVRQSPVLEKSLDCRAIGHGTAFAIADGVPAAWPGSAEQAAARPRPTARRHA